MKVFYPVALIWVLASGVAQAEHLYGSGIIDRETKAILTLRCQEPCTQAAWMIEFEDRSSSLLGKPYSLDRDLEQDPQARTAFQKYINGFAKYAHQTFKKQGLFHSSYRVYIEDQDVTAEVYAETAPHSSLEKISTKDGWNWSDRPKAVSHQYFSNMIQMVVMRALKSEQRKFVSGEQSLENYLNAIRSEEQAKQMVRQLGVDPAEFVHFKNGAEMIRVLERASVSIR